MTREAVYDEQISPLMRRIIAICKEHDVPVFASFQLDDARPPDDDPFVCTTAILPKDAAPALHHCCALIYGGLPPLKIDVRNAEGKITTSEIVFP